MKNTQNNIYKKIFCFHTNNIKYKNKPLFKKRNNTFLNIVFTNAQIVHVFFHYKENIDGPYKNKDNITCINR
jgi:hypothetical protein